MRRTPLLPGIALAAVAALSLSACSGDYSDSASGDHAGHETSASAAETPAAEGHSHEGTGSTSPSTGVMDSMNHAHDTDGGPAPEGIAPATDAKFPVGSEVVMHADHMPGMDGQKATVSGAFSTTTYSVTYTPTTGGEPVVDHKWVVQEELVDPPAAPIPDGTEVTLAATHMQGMEGAKATIVSSTQETVYMVDFDMDGMPMKNHKWVTESELSAA